MEFIQMIIQSLTTQNEFFSNILGNLLAPVEVITTLLLFTTLLNIDTTKNRKIIYVVVLSVSFFIFKTFIPYYAGYINLIILFVGIKFILNVPFIKSIFSMILPFIITIILDTFLSKIYLLILNLNYEAVFAIPLYRLSYMLVMYSCMFGLYKIFKNINFNITLLENMNKKDKTTLLITSILGIITMLTQSYLNLYYSEKLPLIITLLSMLSLTTYFLITIYNLTKTHELEIANQDIESLQLYNKTLSIFHDNIRSFRHDFNNIVQAIGGYVVTKDIDGLSKYYDELLEDCHRVNNLTTLNPEVINNPPIFSVLAAKYHSANEKNIKINLEVFMDLNKLNMKIYEFTRILGILLDNSIEAAEECIEKIINVTFRNDEKLKRTLIVIDNTYSDKDVDTIEIFQKANTSKKDHTGLGLWEVNQILNKNDNLSLYTSKDNNFFKQQLEIYEN